MAAIQSCSIDVLRYVLSLAVPEGVTILNDARLNTPLHEAYRTSDPDVIRMVEDKAIVDQAYGTLASVNLLGRQPKDVSHGRVEHEADYMLMVDKSRLDLVDELI